PVGKVDESAAKRDTLIDSVCKKLWAGADEGDDFLDDNGHFSAVDYKAGLACRERGFLFRAKEALFAAEAEDFRGGLAVTEEMLELVDAIISDWTKKRKEMERLRTPPISTA